ncbi:MAG: hypothetical protein EBS21_12380 [Sphingomonadaceae bacterium]|nr:hypothetical protein [Sphingomonadaceae bacterium]
MFNPIPFSVRMRAAGFVFDKHVRSMNVYDKWVPKGTTVADRKAKAAKVDQTIDILARFVSKWSLSRRSRHRESRWSHRGPNWGDLMWEAEQAETNKLVTMDEHTYSALRRAQIAEYKAVGRDILPLIRSWSHINSLRDEFARKTTLNAVQLAQVWAEVAPKVHNKQRPAQVRRNRFAMDSDSE